jgi:glycosyltransferase involved in cell wall biosynthesis
MTITLAGQPAPDTVVSAVRAAAQTPPGADLARRLDNAARVLALRDAPDEAAFQDRLTLLTRQTAGIEPDLFALPPPRSRAEQARRAVRHGLWRGLRCLFDWVLFRQNAINAQLAGALELQHALHRRTVAELNARLARLESATPAPPGPAEPASAAAASAPARTDGRFDQLLAGYADGDAISEEARIIRARLRARGVAADIFAPANRIGRGVRDDARPLSTYAPAPGDTVLYHAAIATPAAEAFLRTPARRLARYHNITPATWFDGFDDGLAARLRTARAELAGLLAHAETVFADSAYNAAELRALGLDRVRVVPLFFDPVRFETTPDPAVLARFTPPLTNILFVGRLAPNKDIETLLLAFAWYQRRNPFSRLIVAGSTDSCPRYALMLRMLAAQLELPNVCFTGFLSAAGRAACYQLADVFVCASRHEGYCLPLVEAMTCGVPVISRAAGGAPEALDGAGVLFDALEPPELAALIDSVLRDADPHAMVMASQARRLDALRTRDLDADIATVVSAPRR